MSKDKLSKTVDEQILEERKVKALEKISASLDALTIWFEGIDKGSWDDRLQYYLGEWHKSIEKPKPSSKKS